MKFFALISLFAISGLASAQIDPKKQTISELHSQVTKLRQTLDHAVSGYKQHKYGVLARQASKYQISPSVKEWIGRLPANSTYETNKEAEMVMSELTLLRIVYPIISDPAKLTDALKVKALIYGLEKESRNDTTTPNYTELRESVLQIIDRENKIGRNWTKTNLELDDLYDDIDVKDAEAFLVTSEFPAYALGNLKNACAAEKEAICSPKLLEAILAFQGYNNNVHELLPVQSAEVVEKVIEALKKFNKQKDTIDELASHIHVDCDAVACRIGGKHH